MTDKILNFFNICDDIFNSNISNTNIYNTQIKECISIIDSLNTSDFKHILKSKNLNSRFVLAYFINEDKMINISTNGLTDSFYGHFFILSLLNRISLNENTSKEFIALVIKTIYDHKHVFTFLGKDGHLDYQLGYCIGQYIEYGENISFFHHITKEPFVFNKNTFCLAFQEAVKNKDLNLNSIEYFKKIYFSTYRKSYINKEGFGNSITNKNTIWNDDILNSMNSILNFYENKREKPIEIKNIENNNFLWFLKGMNPTDEFIHTYTDNYKNFANFENLDTTKHKNSNNFSSRFKKTL